MGSYSNLFRPLLLSSLRVPSRHIHKYSCLFNQSSVFFSLVGSWAKIWNLIFLRSCFVSLICLIIGPSDKCSFILHIIGLAV